MKRAEPIPEGVCRGQAAGRGADISRAAQPTHVWTIERPGSFTATSLWAKRLVFYWAALCNTHRM